MIEKESYAYRWLIPSLFLFFFISLIPFILAFTYSFRDISFTAAGAQGQWIGFENYRKLMHDPAFFNSLKVTFSYMIPAILLQLTLGMIVALILSTAARKMKIVIPFLLLPTLIAPAVVGLVGSLSLNTEFGLIGIYLSRWGIIKEAMLGSFRWALPAVIFVDTWQWTPFLAVILLSGILSFPKEPFEAAQVDGASLWQTFKMVTMPLLRPYIIVGLLIRVIDAFRIFDIVWIMTRGGPGTITEVASVYAYRLNFRYWHLGYGAANVLVIFLIILVGTSLLYRVLTGQLGRIRG